MAFKNLFYINYWFAQPFSVHGLTFWLFICIFLFLIAVGLVLRIWAQYVQDRSIKLIFRRFASFGMTMGLFGIIWTFFRQERVIFLAWRFWMLVWLLVSVWWMIDILKYVLKRLPVIKKEKQEKEQMGKYLPN
ncbi:MAG: hypothetical protein ABIH87_04170 [bacterium]